MVWSNVEHKYVGKTEEPLCEEGIRELIRYKAGCVYPKLNYLFASPLKRCVQTAELLYPDMTPYLIPEFAEMDFGDFEGKNYEQLRGNREYQKWIDSHGILPFPGGESRENFIARCCRGFDRMSEVLKQTKKEQGGQVAGVIAHGGTIMALLSKYGNGDYFDYQTANGKGYVCTLEGLFKKPQLVNINRLC